MGVCRSRQTGSTTKWDDRYRPYLDRVRLSDVRQLKDVHSDETLITAFIERWRPETSTFHLPFGECTITLEDIAYLTGLPVDGDPVTRPIPTKNSWLKAEFDTLPTDANDTTVECYVRAHILSMFGQFMFVERTGSVVHAYYLMVLEDWDVASRFSWGSAVLSVLYREMSKTVLSIQSTSSMRGDLGGWVSIVQLWAYERIPFLAPVPRSPVVRDLPLGLRYRFKFSISR
ncbi:Protein MAIN-LIKE 1 [Linum perenne]